MQSTFLALPLELVTDASLPDLQLVEAPDFIWHTSDLPHYHVEEVGIPRIFFLSPASTLISNLPGQKTYSAGSSSSSSSSSSSTSPKPTMIMVTYSQVVVFDASIDPPRIAGIAEFSCHRTKVRAVISAAAASSSQQEEEEGESSSKNINKNLPFAALSYKVSASEVSLNPLMRQSLISFLDVDSRNQFIAICDQIARLHGNINCCNIHDSGSCPISPEKAMNMVLTASAEAAAEHKQTNSPTDNNNNANNNNNTGSTSFSSSFSTASTTPTNEWRVSVLPWFGEIIHAPRDPAELLHRSLRTLIKRRDERRLIAQHHEDDENESDEEDEEDEENFHEKDPSAPINPTKLRLLQLPFQLLATKCDENVSLLEQEIESMKESDERKLRAAEITMDHALHSLEEKKNTIKSCAVQYGEQLAEWLALLQSKQSSELDATIRLSEKKQEYARTLSDTDTSLTELYNERRWIEAESGKFAAPEYVQLMARRDALVEALQHANSAVESELKNSGRRDQVVVANSQNNSQNNNANYIDPAVSDALAVSAAYTTSSSPGNIMNPYQQQQSLVNSAIQSHSPSVAAQSSQNIQQNNYSQNNNAAAEETRSVSHSSNSSITNEASKRNVSLFSPARVLKMLGSPRRHQLQEKQREQRERDQYQSQQNTTAHSRAAVTAVSWGGVKDSTTNTNANNNPINSGLNSGRNSTNTAEGTTRDLYFQNQNDPCPVGAGNLSGRRLPLPAPVGLNKPIRIDQSVQQTLHVNASLRKLLEEEREETQTEKQHHQKLDEKINVAEGKLQDVLNKQAVVACDIQRIESDNHVQHKKLDDLREVEQQLMSQLNEVAQIRSGHLLSAEMDRDEAAARRMNAERVLRYRKKETQNELLEKTHEMLKATLSTIAQSRSSSAN